MYSYIILFLSYLNPSRNYAFAKYLLVYDLDPWIIMIDTVISELLDHEWFELIKQI